MSTATNDARQSLPRRAGLAGVLDFAGASHRRACGVARCAFALIAFLPGFFQIPPVDRDEARFAQATKQMLESGEYVDIRFQDEVRYKKPVGIYWLQAAAVKAGEAVGVPHARTTIWLYRLPSLIGAIGAVLLTYWTALAFVPRRAALLAALMMASSILLGVEARLAKTDAVLLLTCVAAMGAMARVYLTSRRTPDVSHRLAFAGDLVDRAGGGRADQGAADPDVRRAHRAHAVDRRSLGALDLELRPVRRPCLAAGAGAAVVRRDRREVRRQLLRAVASATTCWPKFSSGQEAHGAPPGLYFVLFWVTFWPGSMLAGLAAPRIWQARREPGARFLLAWLIPSWIVFEVVITKLPHYVLPLYPAIAILIAGILEPGGLSTNRWLVRGTVGWFVFPAVIAVGVVVIFIVIGHDPGFVAWPFAAAAVIVGLFAWWLYEVDGAERSLLRGMVASVFDCRYGLCRDVSLAPGVVPERAGRRRRCAPASAARRVSPRPAIIRSRAWCSCSAPIRASPMAPARPNSCRGARAALR